jgi:hypothetical protein
MPLQSVCRNLKDAPEAQPKGGQSQGKRSLWVQRDSTCALLVEPQIPGALPMRRMFGLQVQTFPTWVSTQDFNRRVAAVEFRQVFQSLHVGLPTIRMRRATVESAFIRQFSRRSRDEKIVDLRFTVPEGTA